MNRIILSGRLTKDPEVRQIEGENELTITKYTLAVTGKRKKGEEERRVDFIPCTAFGKSAEIAGKHLKKGMKLVVTGKVQTGNYINQEGRKVYTTEVIVREQEFFKAKAGTE